MRARYEEEIASGVQPECISSARKTHKRRSDRKGEDFINEVQELIDDVPGRSMRSIARELDVCERTIRRVVEEDIHYKSYVLKKGQSLSDSTKKRRFEKAKLLLNRLQVEESQCERSADLFLGRKGLHSRPSCES